LSKQKAPPRRRHRPPAPGPHLRRQAAGRDRCRGRGAERGGAQGRRPAPHLRRRPRRLCQRAREGSQMINDDLALRDLSEVADAIAAGRITSVQATEACLARIAVWQPRTNAFLRLNKEKALEQARAMDKELAAGKRRGPLHGVPMAHKDMYYRAGEI